MSSHRLQGNGQAERVNSTLLTLLRQSIEEEYKWDVKLHRVEAQLNRAENKSMGKTPFELIFGFIPDARN